MVDGDQGSAPDFLEAGSDSDRRVPVEFAQESGLVFCGGMELRLHLKLFNNHDGMVTDLEPDIPECEVKWALERPDSLNGLSC